MQGVSEVLRKLNGRQLNHLQHEIKGLYDEYVHDAYWASMCALLAADHAAFVVYTVEEGQRVPVIEVSVKDWEAACKLLAHVAVPLEYAGIKVDMGTDYVNDGLQMCVAIHHFPESMHWVRDLETYPKVPLAILISENEEQATKETGENNDGKDEKDSE